MMRGNFTPIIILFCLFPLFSCHNSATDENLAHEVADSFATRYFLWRFPDAMRYADESGQRLLRFKASNVHVADLRVLHEATVAPEITVASISLQGDSIAVAKISLANVYLMDTLGTEAHLYPEAEATITLVKHNDTWKVRSCQH